MAVGGSLMEALAVSLADFHARVEGAPGQRIAAVGRDRGFVIDLCRQVLAAVADALAWLARALDGAVDFLRIADAFLALLEVAGAAFTSLADQIVFGDAPDRLGLPRGPFTAIETAAAAARTAIATGADIARQVPSPADLTSTRAALRKLLGRRVDLQLQDDGSLGRLLRLIAPVHA